MPDTFSKYFNTDNLHHAYLIEGLEATVMPEISKLLEKIGAKTSGNPDIYKISVDSFKIGDARNLKSSGSEKSFSGGRKIFIISANSFLLEAQNAMLKIFEEPIEDTHFFLVIPSVQGLLPTFVSRFYVIRDEESGMPLHEAKAFIGWPLTKRIDFLKEMLAKDNEGDEEMPAAESARAKAIVFLNALESALHKKTPRAIADTSAYEQIFKAREFLRQPGSSAKSLMESVALVIPNTV